VSEKVAVVGSREGADLGEVSEFLVELREKHPDTILISGGARGVDKHAETTWISLGGMVISLRPKELPNGEFGVERWELGPESRIYVLEGEPKFMDWKSAALYRDMLISEECDRLVAFMAPGGSRGAGFTAEVAENEQKPTYRYVREA
jgi:hypothetical protein